MDKVWQELSDLCKAYPNLWFVIPDTQVSFSHAIRNGKPARYFGPAGTFQATVRETYHGPTNTIMGVMYVRYIG